MRRRVAPSTGLVQGLSRKDEGWRRLQVGLHSKHVLQFHGRRRPGVRLRFPVNFSIDGSSSELLSELLLEELELEPELELLLTEPSSEEDS